MTPVNVELSQLFELVVEQGRVVLLSFRIQGLGFRVSRLGTMGNYALGNYGDYGFQAKAEVRLAFRVSH